jgi:hypothetical protein
MLRAEVGVRNICKKSQGIPRCPVLLGECNGDLSTVDDTNMTLSVNVHLNVERSVIMHVPKNMATQDVEIQVFDSSFRGKVNVDREVVPSTYAPMRVRGQIVELERTEYRTQLKVPAPLGGDSHKMWFCDCTMGYRFRILELESLSLEAETLAIDPATGR